MTAPTVRIDSSDQKHWIQDGDVNAPRIVYLSSDPNCPTWKNTKAPATAAS
ncbi:hypothetical protein C4J90_3647 [Pseudomonas sp. R2-60-08W]|nr:hypothetical protein C4J90_3647 [Pseudomonas sp. R2-60-08W]